QKITGCSLPSLESIARSRYLSRANNILKDSSHPGHHLFTLLPSGRRYRSFRAGVSNIRPTRGSSSARRMTLLSVKITERHKLHFYKSEILLVWTTWDQRTKNLTKMSWT